jgi:hypothetical protein
MVFFLRLFFCTNYPRLGTSMVVGSSTGAGVESDPGVNPDNQRGLFDDNMGTFLSLLYYDSLRCDISHPFF